MPSTLIRAGAGLCAVIGLLASAGSRAAADVDRMSVAPFAQGPILLAQEIRAGRRPSIEVAPLDVPPTLEAPHAEAPVAAMPAGVETECERLADFHMLPTTSAEVRESSAVDWNRADGLCRADIQAHPGDPRFIYALGRVQDHLKNYIEALRDFRAAADAGHVDAMVELGRLYYSGHGVVQNFSLAFDYFSKAAEAGSARALGDVAAMYGNGQGVARDSIKALDLAEKAIEAGNPYGLQLVANAYFYGAGVPRDFKMAAQYRQQAADLGDGQSLKFLANMYEGGYLGPPDPVRASELRRQAQRVDPDSQDPIPVHLPPLRQTPVTSVQTQRRRYVIFRPTYSRDQGQPMVGGIFRAPAAGATCCPQGSLICPGALPRC